MLYFASGGYGSKTFEPVQKIFGAESAFPIVLGRDFSGEVLACGKGVPSSLFKHGDEVI